MHIEYKLKSMLLIIGLIISLITAILSFSNINKVYAEEPQIIAIIYISNNCPSCNSILKAIHSKIPDSIYIDERNISENSIATEYDLIKKEYKITSSSLPLLITQNGTFTTEFKILQEIDNLIKILETANDEKKEETTENITEDTEEKVKNTEQNTINVDVQQLKATIPVEKAVTETSPLLVLFSIAIPIFMFWSVFFIIKKLNL